MKKKDRKFLGVLYPDSTSYCFEELLSTMHKMFPEFAYCLHDKDKSDNGEDKKPHVHWVGRFKAPRAIQSVADEIGVPSNMVEYCIDFRSAVRYLIHVDDPDKFQYSMESIVSSFDLEKYFRQDLDEVQQARSLAGYIIGSRCASMASAVQFALENDCWSTLRRAGSIWSACISENRIINVAEADEKRLCPSKFETLASTVKTPFDGDHRLFIENMRDYEK